MISPKNTIPEPKMTFRTSGMLATEYATTPVKPNPIAIQL
jgi:hypothetical protein